MKLLVDMPLSPRLAIWLNENQHDAVHAAESALNRASDLDVLARATREGRIVITADLDYPRLLALARLAEPGLILFRDGAWSDADVIARIGEVLKTLTSADIEQTIIVIERGRVRRRKLPIE